MRLFKRKSNAVATKFGGKQTQVRIGNSWKTTQLNVINARRRSGAEGVIFFRKVTVANKGRRKTLLLVEKQFHSNHPTVFEFNSVERQFENLNAMRKIPEIKQHIPPTVRLVERKGKKSLLITDLTENGKYLVTSTHIRETDRFISPFPFSNVSKVYEQIGELEDKLWKNGWQVDRDAFLVQVDKRTMEGKKIWICDGGLVKPAIKR